MISLVQAKDEGTNKVEQEPCQMSSTIIFYSLHWHLN